MRSLWRLRWFRRGTQGSSLKPRGMSPKILQIFIFINPLLNECILCRIPPRDLPTSPTSEGASPTADLVESGMASRSPPPLVIGEAEETQSRRAPPVPNRGEGGDNVMANEDISVTEDREGESGQREPSQKAILEPPSHQRHPFLPPPRGRQGSATHAVP